nr:hypothetical protein GCM10025699_60350 [Microbacterium flavescens]
MPAEITDAAGPDARRAVDLVPVTVEIELSAPPASTSDAYLRLHLLSHLLVAPNTINLDGVFGHLPIVTWTNAGPVHPTDFARMRPALQRAGIATTGIDKFPGCSTTSRPIGCGSPTRRASGSAPTWRRARP